MNDRLCKCSFIRDLARCEEYLDRLRLHPALDGVVNALCIGHVRDHDFCGTALKALLSRIPVLTLDQLAVQVEQAPDVVWVTCGSQLGLQLRERHRSVIARGRLFGIVGASAMNAGYADITLRAWLGSEPGEPLIRFIGGRTEQLKGAHTLN